MTSAPGTIHQRIRATLVLTAPTCGPPVQPHRGGAERAGSAPKRKLELPAGAARAPADGCRGSKSGNAALRAPSPCRRATPGCRVRAFDVRPVQSARAVDGARFIGGPVHLLATGVSDDLGSPPSARSASARWSWVLHP